MNRLAELLAVVLTGIPWLAGIVLAVERAIVAIGWI